MGAVVLLALLIAAAVVKKRGAGAGTAVTTEKAVSRPSSRS
jgi:hypothetical protein